MLEKHSMDRIRRKKKVDIAETRACSNWNRDGRAGFEIIRIKILPSFRLLSCGS